MDSTRFPLNPNTPVPALWQLRTVVETGSTNADLLDDAATPDHTVLVAELQTGGRGRLARTWTSPAGAGLTCSLLLRPTVPTKAWGWLPLIAGLALARTVGADARLKWPNDLLLGPDGGKAAGILVQASGDAAVIGIGLNVSTTQAELPVPTATSLALAGHSTHDRAELLGNLLTHVDELYAAWAENNGDAEASGLADAYRAACATIGSGVSVELPSGDLTGEATGVDSSGQLLVRQRSGEVTGVAAGDVTHVRALSD